MIGRLLARFAYALMASLMLASCGSGSTSESTPSSAALLERLPANVYEPGMGDLMSALQLRHAKLWYAGRAENWELVAFELHEIDETFERVERWHPEEDGIPVGSSILAHMHVATNALERSVAQRDGAAFEGAFDLFTQGCNRCHQTMKHGFIVIRRPTAEPVGNQAWKVESSASSQ